MFTDFKKFIMRGNVVDLAVGIVIGAAFTSVVNSLVKGLISPLIALFYGGTNLAKLKYGFHGQEFQYGDLINNAITFLIVALVIFFLVVQPINKLKDFNFGSKETEESTTKKCPYCFEVIASKATRCRACTSRLDKES